VIEPAQTRDVLGLALDVVSRAPMTTPATASSGCDRMTTITKVLIANRGEIAVRIIRTLRSLGIRSVAVYSDADADAVHVRLADEAVRLGPRGCAELPVDRAVLDAARQTRRRDPPRFRLPRRERRVRACACADAGIVFIGPSAEAIEIMGDKISAKRTVEARGVPTVPGLAPRPHRRGADRGAAGVGFPVLIKPSAGGGGKGMHVVERERSFAAAVAAARREAAASFGDDTLFLERYVTSPRHIEVQVIADRTATSCTSASASARCSGGTRRSSKKRPRRCSMPRPAHASARPPARRRAASATSAPARWSSSFPVTAGRVLLHGDEHAPAGRASRHRTRHRPRPRRAAAAHRRGRAAAVPQEDVA
jgi:hypothetical protein